jgi:hypothetical protein
MIFASNTEGSNVILSIIIPSLNKTQLSGFRHSAIVLPLQTEVIY